MKEVEHIASAMKQIAWTYDRMIFYAIFSTEMSVIYDFNIFWAAILNCEANCTLYTILNVVIITAYHICAILY